MFKLRNKVHDRCAIKKKERKEKVSKQLSNSYNSQSSLETLKDNFVT